MDATRAHCFDSIPIASRPSDSIVCLWCWCTHTVPAQWNERNFFSCISIAIEIRTSNEIRRYRLRRTSGAIETNSFRHDYSAGFPHTTRMIAVGDLYTHETHLERQCTDSNRTEFSWGIQVLIKLLPAEAMNGRQYHTNKNIEHNINRWNAFCIHFSLKSGEKHFR